MRTYSTKQAAKMAGIHSITLHRWLSAGKVRPSQKIAMSKAKLWRWTDTDVERVRKYKQENYRKGRGRKPKSKR
jgi:predicted site-specific integrase-resolvase